MGLHQAGMHKIGGFVGATMIFLGSIPSSAQTLPSPAPDVEVQRLTDLVIQAMPYGTVMDTLAEKDPAWPLLTKAPQFSAGQLTCVRNEMSSSGYRSAKFEEVRQFAAAHPESVAGDIKLLEDGAALVTGKLIRAGIAAHESGVPVDTKSVLKSVPAQQAAAFMTFLLAPKYASLRDLSGLGEMFDMSKSTEENRQIGKLGSAAIFMKYSFRAMGICGISPASIM